MDEYYVVNSGYHLFYKFYWNKKEKMFVDSRGFRIKPLHAYHSDTWDLFLHKKGLNQGEYLYMYKNKFKELLERGEFN